ncbi:MAG: hypothetical protein MUC50_16065, partial [Myxococcota bacterium]|nr:hypothetical protein [Myxococcota bacterium]
MNRLLCTTLCLLILLGASIGAAQPGVPSNVQAAIFLKVLKYDKNTVSRSKGNIGFVIILDGKATNRKNEISSGFVVINGQAIEGATIKVSAVTLLSADRLPAAMQATAGNIIYLPQGTTPETSAAVVAYAKANRVPVFTD